MASGAQQTREVLRIGRQRYVHAHGTLRFGCDHAVYLEMCGAIITVMEFCRQNLFGVLAVGRRVPSHMS